MLNLLVRLFIIWALARLAIDALQHRPAVLVVGLLALVAMALVVRRLLLPGPPQGAQARQRRRLSEDLPRMARLSALRTERAVLATTMVAAVLLLVCVLAAAWIFLITTTSGAIKATARELAAGWGVLLGLAVLFSLAVRVMLSGLRRNREAIEAAISGGRPPSRAEAAAGPQAPTGQQRAPWPGRRIILVGGDRPAG
jgi:hypothetical protein